MHIHRFPSLSRFFFSHKYYHKTFISVLLHAVSNFRNASFFNNTGVKCLLFTPSSYTALCMIDVVVYFLQLLKWLDTPSQFYDGPCEGLYLRVDEDANTPEGTVGRPYCLRRGKLVRPDFLQGIEEQWTRQQLTKNIVRY